MGRNSQCPNHQNGPSNANFMKDLLRLDPDQIKVSFLNKFVTLVIGAVFSPSIAGSADAYRDAENCDG